MKQFFYILTFALIAHTAESKLVWSSKPMTEEELEVRRAEKRAERQAKKEARKAARNARKAAREAKKAERASKRK